MYSSFKKFLNGNELAVMSTQVSCLSGEKRKQHLAFCHIPIPPGQQDKPEEEERSFYSMNEAFKIRYSSAALVSLTMRPSELPLSQMLHRYCSQRGWMSSTLQQMCAFDLDSSCTIPASPLAGRHVDTARPGQGQSLKLKLLLKGQFTAFHNMRGLRNHGVRGSRPDTSTGMLLSLQWILESRYTAWWVGLTHRYVSIFAVSMLICNDYLCWWLQ